MDIKDINVRMQILKRSALFKDFPDFTLKNITEHSEILSYPHETIVLKTGDTVRYLYIIAMGKVTLYKDVDGKEIIADNLEPGDYFGELGFLNKGSAMPLTVQASAKTILFTIPSDIFMALSQQNYNVAYNLMKTMSMRINNVYEKLVRTTASIDIILQAADNVTTNHPKAMAVEETSPVTPVESTLSKEEIEAMKKMIYQHKQECPYCRTKFTTPRILSRHIRIQKTDSDFCIHYNGINPLFYEVSVCPKCNYTYTEQCDSQLGSAQINVVKEVLKTLPKLDFSSVRDINLARESYIMALKCQDAAGSKKSVLAKFYLRMAWIYRYLEDGENEKKYLELALEKYETAFSSERLDGKTEIQLMYMIGELYNRLGDPKNSINWFSRLVIHPEQKSFPAMVNQAREQWQEMRLKMKEQN